MKYKKASFPIMAETIFDLGYLSFVFCTSIYLFVFGSNLVQVLWGVMAFVLVGGDAFHLVPRIRASFSSDRRVFQIMLGRGKLITSITMTIFYVILWYIGLQLFSVTIPFYSTILIGLAILRIVLCLMPQNGWTQINPSLKWGIYRNIPFLLLGMMVMAFYGNYARAQMHPLHWMWLAILLSFAFYLPVVLYAHKIPQLGMLMLPKSCVYIWIVCMGLLL